MKRFAEFFRMGLTASVMLAFAAGGAAAQALPPPPQEVPPPNALVLLTAASTNPGLATLPATSIVEVVENAPERAPLASPTAMVVAVESVPAASTSALVVAAAAVAPPPVVEPPVRAPSTDTLYVERGEIPAGVKVSTNASLISIQLDQTPLEEVVKLFVRVSGANIIVSATNLAGHVVTANLDNVEWKPALISILNQFNLDIFEKTAGSQIYSIGPKLPGTAEPMVSEHFPLSFASVSNVMPVVISILGGSGGSVVGFPAGNSLVVRATDRQLQEVRTVIKAVDTQRKQVYIETKFVELTDQAIKDLGINWKSLQRYSASAGPFARSITDNRLRTKTKANTLSETDARKNTDTVTQNFDKDGNQIELAPGSARTVADSIDRGRTVGSDVSDTINNTFTDVRTAVLSADAFAVVLSALQQKNGISIVSNPKLIVANEVSANIHIGQNQPNIRGSVVPGQLGQANTTTYALDAAQPYFKFGITLDVTPTINTDTNITVRIQPKLSRFVLNIPAPDGTLYPQTSETTLDTVFALGAERTAVIGGLTETDTREDLVKIPLLGDIPIIGKYLFSWNHKSKLQVETIIFVTVGIADPAVMLPSIGLPREAELVMDHLKSRGISTNRAPLLNDLPSPTVK